METWCRWARYAYLKTILIKSKHSKISMAHWYSECDVFVYLSNTKWQIIHRWGSLLRFYRIFFSCFFFSSSLLCPLKRFTVRPIGILGVKCTFFCNKYAPFGHFYRQQSSNLMANKAVEMIVFRLAYLPLGVIWVHHAAQGLQLNWIYLFIFIIKFTAYTQISCNFTINFRCCLLPAITMSFGPER